MQQWFGPSDLYVWDAIREVWREEPGAEKREFDFRVYKELMFGEEANEPAPGTDDYWRICTPFPLELTLPAADAARAFELHIDELESFAYFSPGAGFQT